jgi:hypothetical protein
LQKSIMLLSSLAAALFALPSTSALAVRTGSNSSDYLANSITTAHTLQKLFYQDSIGLWTTVGADAFNPGAYWWTSASCVGTLGLLASLDNSTLAVIEPIINNTFVKAYAFNVEQTGGVGNWMQPTIDEDGEPNSYYREALLWAMSLSHAYDVTGSKEYLLTSLEIFEEIAYVSGANATCGGIWADTRHTKQDSLTQVLFLAVATHLATRLDNGAYYSAWSIQQWNWIQSSGLILPDFLIVKDLDVATCKPVIPGPTFSETVGIAIGGALELNKAAPNSSYITFSENVANASIKALSDSNGILTEYGSNGSPFLGIVKPTYKGLWIRHAVLIAAKVNDTTYVDYIHKQADSIWKTSRDPVDNTLGPVWDHFYPVADASTHCAAFDALVAAATIA